MVLRAQHTKQRNQGHVGGDVKDVTWVQGRGIDADAYLNAGFTDPQTG